MSTQKFFNVLRRGKPKTVSRDPGFPEVSGSPYLHVLSEVVSRSKAEWYLEIGSRTGQSLAHVGCNFIAIDPEFRISNPVFRNARQMHFFQMTSDDFFASGYLDGMSVTPDVAFIDGMHHFEYALRDFINCEASMAKDGTVILHDVCPSTFAMATRDMSELEARRPWTGDVWKVVVALLDHRPDLEVHVLDCYKTGLCIVRGLDPLNTKLQDNIEAIIAQYINLNLSDYGPESYFGRFKLASAQGFAARSFD
jgi:hypothetical protein